MKALYDLALGIAIGMMVMSWLPENTQPFVASGIAIIIILSEIGRFIYRRGTQKGA